MEGGACTVFILSFLTNGSFVPRRVVSAPARILRDDLGREGGNQRRWPGFAERGHENWFLEESEGVGKGKAVIGAVISIIPILP